MATFKKVDLVEARQFTGGVQNGSDLLLWIQSNKGRASFVTYLVERVILEYSYAPWKNVYIGDWIVLHSDNSFSALRPQDFEDAGYEPA